MEKGKKQESFSTIMADIKLIYEQNYFSLLTFLAKHCGKNRCIRQKSQQSPMYPKISVKSIYRLRQNFTIIFNLSRVPTYRRNIHLSFPLLPKRVLCELSLSFSTLICFIYLTPNRSQRNLLPVLPELHASNRCKRQPLRLRSRPFKTGFVK